MLNSKRCRNVPNECLSMLMRSNKLSAVQSTQIANESL